MKKFLARQLIKLLAGIHLWSYKQLSHAGCKAEGGLHPKHRIMKYHEFFIDHLQPSDVVLDAGCGNGKLSNELAKKAKLVIGIDISRKQIMTAKKHYKAENLRFERKDIQEYQSSRKINVIILSNVLEHLKDRTHILKTLQAKCDRILIRVPLITRGWLPVYLKSLGIEYRLDKTHVIEYTEQTFMEEISKAGLKIQSSKIAWGELYAVLEKRT